MEFRTGSLVLRLLQRHLPVLKQGQLPGLLPRVSLSSDVTPGAVAAAAKRMLDASVPRQGWQLEPGVDSFSDAERNSFGKIFMQPNLAFSSLDRARGVARVDLPSQARLSFARASDVDARSSEPVWGFKLGFRLKSGMYMPAQHEEEGWEASSVKRKRKKKMNKHKQRKLRRRDRHRN